ncbi:MAG: carbamoyltransferase HypF, partial [Nitrospirota bacterium]
GASPAVIGAVPLFEAIVDDMRNGVPAQTIAKRFHNTVSEAVLKICEKAKRQTEISRVALSGGVFQNATLFESALDKLKTNGFSVITHSKVPTNDACVSLGQAAIAAALNS